MVIYEEWMAERLSPATVPKYRRVASEDPKTWVYNHCSWYRTEQGLYAWWSIDAMRRDICETQEVVFSRPKEVL